MNKDFSRIKNKVNQRISNEIKLKIISKKLLVFILTKNKKTLKKLLTK